jgi:tRNA threonylcarbamoyladenosine biosynthesis protein TsaB
MLVVSIRTLCLLYGGIVRILVIDTCGEIGSIALAEDTRVIGTSELPAKAASSALLLMVRTLLEHSGWHKNDLDAVGVVSGPGSFTGVRVGLAAAQGLCEALGTPLVAVSRLEVLAHISDLDSGFAVLEAGRGELYVRQVQAKEAREYLCTREDLLTAADGQRVVVAEPRLVEALEMLQPKLVAIDASAALPLVLRDLQADATSSMGVHANYVRTEQQIYGPAKLVRQEGK